MKTHNSKTILIAILLILTSTINNLLAQISYLGQIAQYEDGIYGLRGPMGISFSIDKKNLYVGSQYALAVFNYDEGTGQTDFVEAYRYQNNGHDGLHGVNCIKISPDDKFVYISAGDFNRLSLYKRNSSNGKLELLKIYIDDQGVDGLRGAHELGITTDGKYLFVAAYNDAKISTFLRDTSTGLITYLHSINRYDEGGIEWPEQLKLSRDDRFVYAVSNTDDKLNVYEINAETGELNYKQSISKVGSQWGFNVLEVSHDNKYLYLSGGSQVSIYRRDLQTGKLTLMKVFENNEAGVSGLKSTYSMAVSPDDKYLYAITTDDTSFVTFSRNLTNDVFQFIESKPFMNYAGPNYGRSSTSLVCDNNFVFGTSYWEFKVHQARRNEPNGELTYEKQYYEGEGATIDGLYNPISCCADEQRHMVFVSSYAHGISIFQRNDTTGKLIYKNVANACNQHSKMLNNTEKIVLSKDGNYLYAISRSPYNSGISIFKVDHTTQKLLLIDSIMSNISGYTGICAPVDIMFTPEGDRVYVCSAMLDKQIAQFAYNPQNGSLILEDSYFFNATSITFNHIYCSKSGKYFYIYDYLENIIGVLERDISSGKLTYLSKWSWASITGINCRGLSSLASSPDGKHLYAAFEDSHVLICFAIDSLKNQLEAIQVFDFESSGIAGLKGIKDIKVRNDGTFVYTSSYDNNSLGLFYRDQETGMLTFLKDYTEPENDFDGLDKIVGMCIPFDDRNLYMISNSEEAVSSYSIDLYLGPDRAFCKNDSALLDAGKGFVSYLWSTNETTQQIYAKEEGYYSVKTTDEFGFVDYDTVYIEAYQFPQLDLGPDVFACEGEPIVLQSGFSGNNIWSTGDTTEAISVINAGTYAVKITDGHLCKNSDSINVVIYPMPEVNLGADTSFSSDQSLTLELEQLPDYSYLWFNGSTSSNVTLTAESFSTNTIVAWAEVVSNYGCKSRDSITIKLDIAEITTPEIKVGPIPTHEFITIESNLAITTIECFDISGKHLFNLAPNSKISIFSIKKLQRGAYFLRTRLINGFVKTRGIFRM